MWSRVGFEGGDTVMVSMAAGEVKIFRLRALLPSETIATISAGGAAIAWGMDWERTVKDEGAVRLSIEILDRFTQTVLACADVDEVQRVFDDLTVKLLDDTKS